MARGKARGMFEFGAKLSISLVDGMAEVHKLSWEPYNESWIPEKLYQGKNKSN